MALIIYPTASWGSYVSETDADTLLAANILDDTAWLALNTAHKEFYLRQASLLIKLRITDPLDTETPDDLKLATSLLAEYSVGIDMTSNDGGNNVKILDITGTLKKEYFAAGRASNSFPDMVSSLLVQYGFTAYGSLTLDRS